MERGKSRERIMLVSLGTFVVLLVLAAALWVLGGKSGLYARLVFCGVILALAALAIGGICLVRYLVDRLPGSAASNPSGVTVSMDKLLALLQMFGETKLRAIDKRMIAEIAMSGDCQPAVVVGTDPLLIAAFSEDMDCVAMLRFPESLRDIYGLAEGERLVTANLYQEGRTYVADLIQPEGRKLFANMQPIVLDFIADRQEDITARKRAIPEQVWYRATERGRAYLSEKPGVARSGNPCRTYKPGKAR